jgi:hypothetical protein
MAMKYTKAACFLLAIMVFLSCKEKDLCVEATQKNKGTIVSVDGPHQIAIGEQVALTIGVATNKSWCIKGAEGTVFHQGNNNLHIEANLLYTNTPKKQKNCDCNNDSTIYTLIYFTPLDSGTYTFNYENDSLAGLNNTNKFVLKVE